jgi:hypothetical protein
MTDEGHEKEAKVVLSKSLDEGVVPTTLKLQAAPSYKKQTQADGNQC